jgi:hypothetical protein
MNALSLANDAGQEIVGEIAPAERYTACDELWLITTYFNPNHSRLRLKNYHIFSERMKHSGLKLLTLECAFGDDPFELSPSEFVQQVRARDLLWQGARLLNLLISRLPSEAEKVAWIDCDVLFCNPDWAVETSHRLDSYPVVQTFATFGYLPPHRTTLLESECLRPGFGYVWAALHRGRHNYTLHGHNGFGWACRREILDRCSLYDATICGGADHLMAHAMVGEFDAPCVLNVYTSLPPRWMRQLIRWLPGTFQRRLRRSRSSPLLTHFRAWADPFYREVKGRVGYTPGIVLHLWHGKLEDRQYATRYQPLLRQGFDPATDLRIDQNGCWEWTGSSASLRSVAEWFAGLREDADLSNQEGR